MASLDYPRRRGSAAFARTTGPISGMLIFLPFLCAPALAQNPPPAALPEASVSLDLDVIARQLDIAPSYLSRMRGSRYP